VARHTAFEILYKDYYVRVFGLCRKLLISQQLAEDATQETFMRAYKSFAKFDNDQPFWQWISTIANNHCIDVLRSRSRTKSLFEEASIDLESSELGTLDSADSPVLTELISGEAHTAINAAVSQLPDKYRVPLVLAYFSDASYEQIAEQLDVSRNHVGVLLLRAKQHLRDIVSRGEDHE